MHRKTGNFSLINLFLIQALNTNLNYSSLFSNLMSKQLVAYLQAFQTFWTLKTISKTSFLQQNTINFLAIAKTQPILTVNRFFAEFLVVGFVDAQLPLPWLPEADFQFQHLQFDADVKAESEERHER